MARVRKTTAEKRAVLKAWRMSGIGTHRFCRENGVSPKTLRAWAAVEGLGSAFVPVRVVEPPASSAPLVVELVEKRRAAAARSAR